MSRSTRSGEEKEKPKGKEKENQKKQSSSSSSIPEKIDKDDLHSENGMLMSPAEITALKAWVQENKEALKQGRRINKSELIEEGVIDNPNFSVAILPVKDDFQVVAIYRGGEHSLGRGSVGAVKLGQDLNTGEFVAIKTERSVLTSEKRLQKTAIQAMVELGEATGAITYQPAAEGRYSARKNSGEFETGAIMYVMKLGEGESLASNKQWNVGMFSTLPLAERNYIAAQIIELVSELHKKGFLHLDIKLENFLYDPKTKKVSLIDYGLALKADTETGYAYGDLRGTPGFNAQEIRELQINPFKLVRMQSPEIVKKDEDGYVIIRYSEKTDNFCVGMALAQLYGLIKDSGPKGSFLVADQSSDIFKNNTAISNVSMRKDMQQFLMKMTDSDMTKRPSLAESKQQVEKFNIQCRFMMLPSGKLSAARLFAAEQKAEMQKANKEPDDDKKFKK